VEENVKQTFTFLASPNIPSCNPVDGYSIITVSEFYDCC